MTTTSTLNETNDAPANRTDTDVYVLGGGAVGTVLTKRLREGGHAVTLVDPSEEATHRGDPTDFGALADVGIDSASTVVVAMPTDSESLLVAQQARVRFGVVRVLVLVNHPDRVAVLSDAGHDPLCASTVLADAVLDHL